MGNAGEARLDVVAMGRDEVTVVMNKVSAELDVLKAKLASYEKQQKAVGKGATEAASGTAAFGDKVGDLKEKVGPINKVREAFENLKGNAGFIFGSIAGAIGLVGGALDALAGDLLKGSVAMQRWDAARKTSEEGAKRTEEAVRGLRAELDRLQGVDGPTKLDESTEAANKRLEELRANIVAGTAASKELKKGLDLLAVLPGGAFAVKGLTEDLKKSNRDIVDLKKQQIELNNLLLEGERERTIEALRSVAALQAYLRGDKAASNNNQPSPNDLKVDPTLVPGYVAPGSTKPRGGGRSGSRPEADKRTLAEILAGPTGNDELAKALEGFDANPLDAWIEKANKQAEESAKIFEKIGGDKKNNFASALSDTELAARAASEAFDLLATSGSSLEAVLPGLSGAFTQIADIWAATDGSAKSMAQGVLGSVDAIANAGAAWLKDEKTRTRFLGAKELLLAAPLWFIDPAQAAVKTATGIGLLALGGGGGAGAGGGARSSSGGSAGYMPDRTTGGGPSGPMIVNISTFASDPHTMQRMIAGSRRATAGTGIASAA